MIQKQTSDTLLVGVPAAPAILTDRDELITELIATLTDAEQPPVLALTGPAGAGKTALAAALANHPTIHSYFAGGIFWAGLGDQPQVMATLGSWAQALNEDVQRLGDENGRSWAVKRAIGHRHCLFIIDDARDLKSIFPLRSGGPHGRYLLTTRFDSIAQGFAKTVMAGEVPPLTEAAAEKLLAEIVPDDAGLETEKIGQLAQLSGGNPLALWLLAGSLPSAAAQLLADLTTPAASETALTAVLNSVLNSLPPEAAGHFAALTAFAPWPATFTPEAAAYVAQAEIGQLQSLIRRRLLIPLPDGRLMLPSALTEAASPTATARARHREYYLAWSQQHPLAAETLGDYAQIRRAWKTAEDDRQIIDFAYALRTYHRAQALWPDYIDWHMRALKSAKAYGWQRDLGTLRNNLGVVYEILGEGRQAIEFYQRALEIREQEADQSGLATTLHHMGSIYYRSGMHDRALDAFERLLDIRDSLGNPLEQAAILGNIGSIYDNLGQAQKALDYFQQALTIQKAHEEQNGQAVTLNNIGTVYAALEKHDLATDYYEKALPLREATGDQVGLATTLNNLGTVYSKTGRSEKALACFQRALQIQIKMGDQQGESITRWWLGLLHQTDGRTAEALAELKLAAELAAGNHSPHYREIQQALAELEASAK